MTKTYEYRLRGFKIHLLETIWEVITYTVSKTSQGSSIIFILIIYFTSRPRELRTIIFILVKIFLITEKLILVSVLTSRRALESSLVYFYFFYSTFLPAYGICRGGYGRSSPHICRSVALSLFLNIFLDCIMLI